MFSFSGPENPGQSEPTGTVRGSLRISVHLLKSTQYYANLNGLKLSVKPHWIHFWTLNFGGSLITPSRIRSFIWLTHFMIHMQNVLSFFFTPTVLIEMDFKKFLECQRDLIKKSDLKFRSYKNYVNISVNTLLIYFSCVSKTFSISGLIPKIGSTFLFRTTPSCHVTVMS